MITMSPKACSNISLHSIDTTTTTYTLYLASPVHLMSLPTLLVGILVLVTVAPLEAHPLIPSGNSNTFEYKRYCSSSLGDALRLLCGGSYSSQQYAQYPDSSGKLNSNTLNRLASDDGLYFRSDRVGEILECCRRPCGYSELKMFCAPV